MSEETNGEAEIVAAAAEGQAVRAAIPLVTRLGIDLPIPKDWQAFQRNCVLLFKAELRDPHAQEYGRGGQAQKGIDILARRDGRDDHFVGVQCRLIKKPLKEAKILSDAREALTIEAGLKELIFATTAPDDTGATDAAITVTKLLRAEGHRLSVFVYGWGQLQTLIAPHEAAYNAFLPSAVAISAPQAPSAPVDAPDLAARVVEQLIEKMRANSLSIGAEEGTASSDEDPALHAKIDTFRDLFKAHGQPLIAEQAMLALLESEDLTAKPWAHYRLETNLASIAIDCGREDEAADRFERAQAIRPEDPNARANLALARMIQGRYADAMTTAQEALDAEPRADAAVGYLLQAASRSDWEGNPESLIPPDLVDSVHADLGLAEFLRRRDVPGWAARSLALANAHADIPEFKRIRGLAVLALAIDAGNYIPGGIGPLTGEDLNAAADDMKATVEHLLAIGFADSHDLAVHLNNAAVLLRLCERHEESEALLLLGMPKAADEPNLRRLLALARYAQDRNAEAAVALEKDSDPENRILRAELQAAMGEPAAGLATALELDPGAIDERLQCLRWRVIGECGQRLGKPEHVDAAVAGLRALRPGDMGANLMEIRGVRARRVDADQAQGQLLALVAGVPADLDMTSRYLLASELYMLDLPDEASRLLEDHVDLGRPNPSTSLYLQSLAAARRDEMFRDVLTRTTPEVLAMPGTLWAIAAHAWNTGDLARSMTALGELLAGDPNHPRARLLKIEILIRQDRSNELFAELEKPLEKLAWERPADQFRLVALLGHFGFAERAADYAYRLFLKHRDLARAWTTLAMLVLEEGRGDDQTERLWTMTAAGENAAVNLVYDDASEAFFVIEPDAALRKLDTESWEPDHSLAAAVAGKRADERFTGPDGREGVVREVRHKYVARLHYALKHFEERFPEISGFRSLSVDVEKPGGFDEVIEQVKARRDWIAEEEAQYINGPLPLAVFAARVGMDTIEVAAGLAADGSRIKTATGDLDERNAAAAAIYADRERGCVLDLITLWTAWKLGAMELIRDSCGPIHLPQSVLDQLRARRANLDFFSRDGHRSANYEDGQLQVALIPAETVTLWRDDVDALIAWADVTATIRPVVASDALPDGLRDHLRRSKGDIFDALILARQSELLLLTDDLPIRQLDWAMGGRGGAWLHAVFGIAAEQKHIDLEQYVRWSAQLVNGGQAYLGVSGAALAHAAALDAAAGTVLGPLFRSLSEMIGGSSAEPISHVQAVLACIQILWSTPSARAYREPMTGHLLEQLIRRRDADYVRLLRAMITLTKSIEGVWPYLFAWLRGHFLYEKVMA